MKIKSILEKEKLPYLKFTTDKDDDFNINGTHKIGTLNTTYDKLVKVFGKPIKVKDDDKVRVEWHIMFDVEGQYDKEYDYTETEEIIATIYDWKYGNDTSVEEVEEWAIGGKEWNVIALIDAALGIK